MDEPLDNPPTRREDLVASQREHLEMALSELKGAILQEMEGRLAALESWVRRIGKYLGASQGEHLQEKAEVTRGRTLGADGEKLPLCSR